MPNPTDVARIAAAVRDKRLREGMNVRQAGEAAGVSFCTIARIERTGSASPAVTAKVLAWLEGRSPPSTNVALEDRVARLERHVQSLLRAHLGEKQ